MKAPKSRIRFSEWRNSDFDPKIPGPSSLSRRSIGFWVKSWGGKFWSPDVLGQSPCNVGQSKNHKLPNRWKVWLISTSFFRGRFRNLRSRPLCNGQGSGFRVSYPLGLRCKIIDRFWSMADVTKMSCFFFCFPGICFGCQNSLKHGPRQHAIASVKCVWCFIFSCAVACSWLNVQCSLNISWTFSWVFEYSRFIFHLYCELQSCFLGQNTDGKWMNMTGLESSENVLHLGKMSYFHHFPPGAKQKRGVVKREVKRSINLIGVDRVDISWSWFWQKSKWFDSSERPWHILANGSELVQKNQKTWCATWCLSAQAV